MWIITGVTAAVLIVLAIVLHVMGQPSWCTCGLNLWTIDPWSGESSQNFGDAYTFSHVLHGFIFYLALWLVARKLPVRYRFLIAVLMEMAWEIFENTPFIINRYRDATAANMYTGDTVLNSIGDMLSAMLGFYLAWKLSWKWSVAIVLFIELILLILIRDNLTLNILMLVHPVQAIKMWQAGA